MWHFRHPGIRARAASVGFMALALALASGLASGCGEVSPNDNHSNHNFTPCTEGETRCDGEGGVEICLHGQWQAEQTCLAPDQVCVDGNCVDATPPQGQTVVLQNGLLGYQGCIDTAVPVPEGSGFDEITPQDELLLIYHWVWTGS